MKICAICKVDKPHSEFHKRTRAKDGLQSRCKRCATVDRMQRYWADHDHERNVRNRWSNDNYWRNRALVEEFLTTHPCVDCGEKDVRVLDFDHVRGVKHREVSNLLGSCSWATVLREIEKCEVRCANDHRRRHASERV